MADDPYNLTRFIDAQNEVYVSVLEELKNGKKETHWMWFVFPQIDGLGSSPTAKHYAIKSIEEAKAYLGHPVLHSRLTECTRTIFDNKRKSALEIFGQVDSLKFKSSMTLWAFFMETYSIFDENIYKYFNNRYDDKTIEILRKMEG